MTDFRDRPPITWRIVALLARGARYRRHWKACRP